MSAAPVTIAGMQGCLTEKALTSWLESEGIVVVEFGGRGDLWGYTSRATRTVGLWDGLRTFQRVPALLHEAHHVTRGDTGHQAAAVEAWIDEQVALILIDPSEYAYWEKQFGWNTGGIAHAMELPKWVIRAYRRVLSRPVSRCVT